MEGRGDKRIKGERREEWRVGGLTQLSIFAKFHQSAVSIGKMREIKYDNRNLILQDHLEECFVLTDSYHPRTSAINLASLHLSLRWICAPHLLKGRRI